jgi:type IV pilus assembly protein PilO
MRRNFQRQKIILLAILAAFFMADAAMAIYSFTVASSALSPRQELTVQSTQIKLLKADVARARAIQRDMPKTKVDCDRFEDSLPPARTFYSAINSEFADLGRQAGLQIGSLGFRTVDVPAHGMTEVSVDAKVTGDYKSVVRFINAVQRSKSYYILESLSLAKDAGAALGAAGTVSVDLHFKSYFKGAA